MDSNKAVGAALLQEGQPVAYMSRTFTETETHYAPIEKEMLAIVLSLEHYHQFTFGRNVTVQSDHKPLESILSKPLDRAPRRLQRMMLRTQAYDITIKYIPGKDQLIADMLSRAPIQSTPPETKQFNEVNMASFLPIRDERLGQIRNETQKDETL